MLPGRKGDGSLKIPRRTAFIFQTRTLPSCRIAAPARCHNEPRCHYLCIYSAPFCRRREKRVRVQSHVGRPEKAARSTAIHRAGWGRLLDEAFVKYIWKILQIYLNRGGKAQTSFCDPIQDGPVTTKCFGIRDVAVKTRNPLSQ